MTAAIAAFWSAHAAYKQALAAWLTAAHSPKPAVWRLQARIDWVRRAQESKRHARHLYNAMLSALDNVALVAGSAETVVGRPEVAAGEPPVREWLS